MANSVKIVGSSSALRMDLSEENTLLLPSVQSKTCKNKILPLILKLTAITFGLVGGAVVITQLSKNRPPGNNILGIVGGQDARPQQFPWQVSLQIVVGPTTRSLTCGGTLIDPTTVVTAAHCGAGVRPRDIEVVAGAYRVKNTGEPSQERIKIASFISHPDFDIIRVRNDVAIIKLSRPVKFNEFIQPLRLPPKNVDILGQVCVTTGWGNANPSGVAENPIIPNVLQAVNLTVISNTFCEIAYGRSLVDDSKLCVHDFRGGKSPCNGDSGGPLVCSDSDGPFLAGITSFGPETCGIKEGPNVFTRVESMLDFIEKNTQEDTLIV